MTVAQQMEALKQKADQFVTVSQQLEDLKQKADQFMTVSQQLEDLKQKADQFATVSQQLEVLKQKAIHALAQGEEIGIEKGVRQTAINLLEHGISEKTVSKCTGLSLEEIRNLIVHH